MRLVRGNGKKVRLDHIGDVTDMIALEGSVLTMGNEITTPSGGRQSPFEQGHTRGKNYLSNRCKIVLTPGSLYCIAGDIKNVCDNTRRL
jgi:hypothetical protein